MDLGSWELNTSKDPEPHTQLLLLLDLSPQRIVNAETATRHLTCTQFTNIMAADAAARLTEGTSINGTNGSSMPPRNTVPMEDGETTATGSGLSADEIALYDRQIRLWGAQAQERIRSANILLVSLRALGTEIAKNLTLAGISSLTIIDDEAVTEEDLGAQYFVREADIGKPVRFAPLH